MCANGYFPNSEKPSNTQEMNEPTKIEVNEHKNMTCVNLK